MMMSRRKANTAVLPGRQRFDPRQITIIALDKLNEQAALT